MLDLFLGEILYMGIIQQLEKVVLHIDIKFQLDQTNRFTINLNFLHKMLFKKLFRNLSVYYLKFFIVFNFFIVKNWFRTKKYSCKFSQKSIIKKIQIVMVIFLTEVNYWPYLYLLNYKFFGKFTRILLCLKSMFDHKKLIK